MHVGSATSQQPPDTPLTRRGMPLCAAVLPSGVRSGTAAVTDALYRQLQQLVLQLHALVIQHEEAGAVLVQLAGSLSLMEGQQLQVSIPAVAQPLPPLFLSIMFL